MPHSVEHEDFLRLFLQYEEDLRAYARSLLPNREFLAEVIQEASVIMWRKLDQLEETDQFLPWAKVIVRYEALKLRQKVARDRLSFSEKVYELLAADDEDDGDPLEQERAAMESCLSQMEPEQRELVLLPYLGHGSVARLAEKSGRTENSLYKKIGRLRTALAKCIGSQLSADLHSPR
ncbi:MAG: sigma-70 family RNA polymerase sigma factor [Verrucomicrobiota bacterium]